VQAFYSTSLVVDDHELTRFSLKLALSPGKYRVSRPSQQWSEAVQMVERHHPDIIILDLQMPVMDGWSASTRLKRIEPNAQIIAYLP